VLGRCRSRGGRRRSRGLDSSTPPPHRVSGFHAPPSSPPLHFEATAPGTFTADPRPGVGPLLLEEAAGLESASHHTLHRPLPLLRACHQKGAELAAGAREREGNKGRTRPSSQRGSPASPRRRHKIRPSLRRSLRAGVGPPPPHRPRGTPPCWQGARAAADPGSRSLRSPSSHAQQQNRGPCELCCTQIELRGGSPRAPVLRLASNQALLDRLALNRQR
jgi:hypothetical protein